MSLKFHVADKVFNAVKDKWGVRENGSQPHSHPVLANERNLARATTLNKAIELAGLADIGHLLMAKHFSSTWRDPDLGSRDIDEIKTLLSGMIVNVGGRPMLNGSLLVKSCQPILLPSDYNRHEEYKSQCDQTLARTLKALNKESEIAAQEMGPILTQPWMCSHTFSECNCYPNARVYISIHSLYYLSPLEIFNKLMDRNIPLIAAFHQFPAPFGHLGYGEAEYRWNPKQEQITMTVKGNLESYVHGDLRWLWGGSWSAGMAGTLTWSTLTVIGDTTIAVFRATPKVIPRAVTQAPDLMMGLRDQTYIGDVSWSTIKDDPKSFPDYGDFPIKVAISSQLFSYLGWMVIGSDDTVCIPKSLVYDLAQRCVGKRRDKSLLDTLVLHARANARKLAMPEEKRMEAIIYSSYLAMSVGAEMEMNAIASHESNKSKWSQLNRFYSDSLTIIPRWVAILAAAVVGSAVVIAPVRPKYKITGLMCLTGMVGSILKKPPSPGATAHKVTNVCCRGIPTEPQRLGSQVHVTEDKECYPGFGAKLVGFGVQGVKPTVARNCVHNDYLAIRNRVVLENREIEFTPEGPKAIDPNWEDVHKLVRGLDRLHPLSAISSPVRAMPFEAWLSSIPLAGSRKAMLSRMRETLKHKNFNTRMQMLKDSVRMAFTKIEKVVGNPEACPRLISGCTPEFQVATGPITKSLAMRLKTTWNMDNYIVYASGLRPSDLGRFVEQIDELPPIEGGYVLIELDFGRFDATQSRGSLTTEHLWYELAQIARKYRDILKIQLHARGITANGVVFSIDYGRNSGDGNTSCGNSIVNGYVVTDAIYVSPAALDFITSIMGVDVFQAVYLGNYKPLEEFLVMYTRMIVLGDDNLALVPKMVVNKEQIESTLSRRGLRPELVVRHLVWDAEFCSGRFYPSSRGTRWGPKIGRFLAKTGWALKPYGEKKSKMWLRGVALGMIKDFGHIPVIRACLEVALRLTAGVKPMEELYLKKYQWYEHDEERAEAIEQTYLMLCHLYDCTISDIRSLEDCINATRSLPALLDHPLALRMVQVDNKIKYEEHAAVEDTGPKHIPGATFTWSAIKRSLIKFWDTLVAIFPAWNSDLVMDIVIIAPVFEEMLKKISKDKRLPVSIACAGIIAFECATHVIAGGEAYEYFPTAIMHIVCDQLPMFSGTAVHMLFNLWALVNSGDLPPPPPPPLPTVRQLGPRSWSL